MSFLLDPASIFCHKRCIFFTALIPRRGFAGAPTQIRIPSLLKGSASFNLVLFVYWRARIQSDTKQAGCCLQFLLFNTPYRAGLFRLQAVIGSLKFWSFNLGGTSDHREPEVVTLGQLLCHEYSVVGSYTGNCGNGPRPCLVAHVVVSFSS